MPATSEQDPFLSHSKAAERNQGEATKGFRSILRTRPDTTRPGSPQQFHAGQLALICLLPWLTMVAVLALFTWAYYPFPRVVWLAVLVLVVLGIHLVHIGNKRPDRIHWSYVGALSITAIALASVVGFFCYNQYLVHYWVSTHYGNSYVNVFPSEASSAFADAGKIVFVEEARVDGGKSVGYKDVTMYCVAPIMDDAQQTTIQFWAVGMDCCTRRGYFSCDDAWSYQARAGVVISDVQGLTEDRYDRYMTAIHQAEEAYDIVSAPKPIFVRWVADPAQVESEFFWGGFTLECILACSFLAFLVVVVCMLSTTGRHSTTVQRRTGATRGAVDVPQKHWWSPSEH